MIKKIFAQDLFLPGMTDPVTGPIPNSNSQLFTIGGIVSRAIPYIILFAGVGTLLMILFGGFQLLTGATDPKQLENGKKRITYGLVGFFVVFLSFWLVQAIAIIFGIREFACVFPVPGLTCNQ
jgi:hypothetical protein